MHSSFHIFGCVYFGFFLLLSVVYLLLTNSYYDSRMLLFWHMDNTWHARGTVPWHVEPIKSKFPIRKNVVEINSVYIIVNPGSKCGGFPLCLIVTSFGMVAGSGRGALVFSTKMFVASSFSSLLRNIGEVGVWLSSFIGRSLIAAGFT